jgi:hypothetical protein
LDVDVEMDGWMRMKMLEEGTKEEEPDNDKA